MQMDLTILTRTAPLALGNLSQRKQSMNFQRLVAVLTGASGIGRQQRRRRLSGLRRRDQRLAAFEPLEHRHLLTGTVSLVLDINPGTDSGAPARFTEVNGQAFFTATDG